MRDEMAVSQGCGCARCPPVMWCLGGSQAKSLPQAIAWAQQGGKQTVQKMMGGGAVLLLLAALLNKLRKRGAAQQ